MLEVTNMNVYGFEEAIRGMRNSWNSHDKSDSAGSVVGEEDLKLMKNLVKAGSSHRKFMRFIEATMDIRAPLYWWKQADTYSIGRVSNSTSTMHTICEKKFDISDFAHDRLSSFDMRDIFGCIAEKPLDTSVFLEETIQHLNTLREGYLCYKKAGDEEIARRFWYAIIQLLPESYLQTRTWKVSYETLLHMTEREGHKLFEWAEFLGYIRTLPYAKQLIFEEG